MKNIILTDVENDLLLSCLEELIDKSDSTPIEKKWETKLKKTRKLFDLELEFYKISKGQSVTKKEMTKWLLVKIKNKTSDIQ